MISKLTIDGFKAFGQSTDIRFRPITILLGRNSSGKTSIIQALLALKQTLQSTDTETPLILNSQFVQLGSYRDTVYGHDTTLPIHLRVELTASEADEVRFRRRRPPPSRAQPSYAYDVSFRYDPDKKTIYLSDWALYALDPEKLILSVVLDSPGADFVLKSDHFTPALRRNKGIANGLSRSHFSYDVGFPGAIQAKTAWMAIQRIVYETRDADWLLSTSLRKLSYLGPLRDPPERTHVAAGESPRDVGLRGEKATDVLYAAPRRRGNADLARSVRIWMRRFGLAHSLSLREIKRDSGILAVRLVDPITRLDVGMTDVGFGASQIFPIIVQGFYAEPGTLLAMEQPEIHLHPSAQGTLADLLVEFANLGRFLLVETHSEHLLLRLQRRVAEGVLDPRKIAIYVVEPTPAGSTVREVTLDEKGDLSNWPAGFFEEDVEDIYSRVVANIKSATKGGASRK